jgi:hypothetical protein
MEIRGKNKNLEVSMMETRTWMIMMILLVVFIIPLIVNLVTRIPV